MEETQDPRVVEVPEGVYRAIKQVGDSGATNMFVLSNVFAILELLAEAAEDDPPECAPGYLDAVVWIQDHKSEYAQGILDGFKVAA